MSTKPLDELGSTLRLPDSLREPEPPFKLDRHDKIAVVAPNVHIGEHIQKNYLDQPWIKVIWPGCSVMGWRFAMILVAGSTLKDILRGGPPSHKRWWDEQVRCRLTRHGQIMQLP
jgi:hypothetical protein